jgi:hypothetical protein
LKIAFLIAFLFVLTALAQTAPNVLNEVLFSVAGEASTVRDQQIYQAVLDEVFHKPHLSRFSQKPATDFLLSRLSFREASTFDLTSDKIKISENSKKKLSEFSSAEIEREANIVSRALLLIELKENQLKQQERFDTWFEVLKRKYQVKYKVTEIK